jgi:phosphatidylinositol kinase/protein kinase (PI-3  family)
MAMLEAFVYDPLISWRLLTRRDNETALDATVPLGRAAGTVLSVITATTQKQCVTVVTKHPLLCDVSLKHPVTPYKN